MTIPTLTNFGMCTDYILNHSKGKVINAYYGFNVSKIDKEPIDQIQAFIAAKRIQDYNKQLYGKEGMFFPFIAGAFEVMNLDDINSIIPTFNEKSCKESIKKALFEKIMDKYQINGQAFVTSDLWKEKAYWEYFYELLDTKTFTEEGLIKDTAQHVYKDLNLQEIKQILEKKIRFKDLPSSIANFNPNLIAKIGEIPASILYTPAEVAEAVYFCKKENANLKIGPVAERSYDKYIKNYMDIIHLNQPTALNSQRLQPITVTPYIAKPTKNKIRIFFDDNASSIQERLRDIKPEEYVFTMDKCLGKVFNPFLEKAVYAIESANCMEKTPVKINGFNFYSGIDVLEYAKKGGKIRVLKDYLPDLCEQYLIMPFR